MHDFITAFQAIDPVAISVGPLQVRWYGLAYAAGFICAFFLMKYFAKRWKTGLTLDDMLTIMIYAIVGVVLGGRLGYCLFYGQGYYFAHPLEILSLWDGGMSFHGGFIGILVGGLFAARSVKTTFFTIADLGAIGAPLGFGLGRLANFVNGELWGRVTTSSWGIVFVDAGPLPRIPSQLIEAVLEGLLLFVIMIVLAMKKPPFKRGTLVGVLTILYGCFRIFSEFFREPDASIGFLSGGWLTMGMLLSVPMVVGGFALIVWAHRQEN